MSFDVIVVGAGPSGSAAAEACAQKGLSVLCIEEHGTVGYPVQCAGLLSNSAFAECRTSEHSVLNRISGARLISGAGNSVLINANTTKAVVVDRCALDREMVEIAADAGAELKIKTSVYGVQGSAVLTRGVHGHEEIGFKILIAADGPRSTVSRLYGMPRAKVFLSGIQAEIPGDYDPRFVEIFPDASPEFFGWAIPSGKHSLRLGLCGQSLIPERFGAFRKMFGASTTHFVTGTLPLGVMPKTYGHKTLFVGDAAGFAKPTSGGGVYTGIRTARHAAEVAVACCENDRFDDGELADYERRWKADLGRELDLGFRLFGMRQKLSSKDIDSLIRALDDPEILATIVQYGDMDRPGAVVRQLLKKPAFFKLMGPLLKSGILSFFR